MNAITLGAGWLFCKLVGDRVIEHIPGPVIGLAVGLVIMLNAVATMKILRRILGSDVVD